MLSDEEIEEKAKEDLQETKESLTANAEKLDEKKPAAKLIKAEEKGEGRISRRALFSFFG